MNAAQKIGLSILSLLMGLSVYILAMALNYRHLFH